MKKTAAAQVVILMFLFISIPAVCAEIDGEWTGILDGPDGKKIEVSFFFKADGNTFLASMKSELWFIALTEGKIDGKNIEFKFDPDYWPRSQPSTVSTIIYHGTISGDEIHMTQTSEKEKTNYVLKRHSDQIDILTIEDGIRTNIKERAKR